MFFTQASWKSFALTLACASALSACSKEQGAPKIFLPRLISADGQDLQKLKNASCGDGSHIDLRDNVVTPENFRAIFRCANYDKKLNALQPLVESRYFPELVDSVNRMLKAENSEGLKKTLDGWLKDGPDGTSRADRLLPFLADMIKNPSFEAFLPVLDAILQAGQNLWSDLLPGLANVIYTERFPFNMEDAMEIVSSFGGEKPAANEQKDYAKTIKAMAAFMQSDVDGKSASMRMLELADGLNGIKLPENSLYKFIEHMLEKGTLEVYFNHGGFVRGEVVDARLNAQPDPAGQACEGLNETPEQRQECAHMRMFQRAANGGDAPLTQLAGLIAELQKSHPEMLPDLAKWFGQNSSRLGSGLHGFVIRQQVVGALGRLTLDAYLKAYGTKQGLTPATPLNADQFVELVAKGFADPAFLTHLEGAIVKVNRATLGDRNARLATPFVPAFAAEIAAVYAAKEISAYARTLFSEAKPTLTLMQASTFFANKNLGIQVELDGGTKSVSTHLSNRWWNLVNTSLGEEVVVKFALGLIKNILDEMAAAFTNKGQTLAEWYYTSPYGNPATTEMILALAIDYADIINRYKTHREWLRTEWVEEVFAGDDDKRAARLLIDQVPNIVLYIRSGMSRSGADLTRALGTDKDGYLVKSYVNLVVQVTETGWLRKGVRLIEAWQNRPDKGERGKAFTLSDEIPERRKYKKGIEATHRLLRSLIQPEREGDYSTSTLGRIITPLSAIVGDARRGDTEHFLTVSAKQLQGLSDKQINDFFNNQGKSSTPGTAGERTETFRAAADLLRDPNFPGIVRSLSGLFQEKAVQPALKFFQQNVDDGTLPNVLLLIRRIMGYAP